ncbi:Uncharacterized protein TCM_032121 isoform 2, partial [Theobroma cacao]
MKRKRGRKNHGRGREKRTVLLHFEGGKESFLLQFLEKEKAENFEKLCEFVAENFGGFAVIKGQQSAANLCRKIGANCCQFVQKNCAEKLELFAANLCRKIGKHCAANLREKKQLGAAKFLRKREMKVLPPEEEENDPRKRGSHSGEERKTW